MNYNLIEEKWLLVLWKNGDTNRVGIIEALTQAERIRQIAASNPMDRVAVLRFLLALLYWCQGNAPDKIPDDSFPPDWFEKLHDNKDSFDLLGKEKRFYQCKPVSGKDEKLSANYLMQEVPTGINISHFKHSTDGINGLCRACCARGLLRLPSFATSGGRGKPPGINAKPPIYVIPLGSSLAETLWFSWRQVSSPNLGTPAWEKPDSQLPKTGEIPLLTGLTWLPRRVWLDNPEGPEAHCISCGRKEQLIRQCVFAGIGSTKSDGDRIWRDLHVIRDSKDMVVKPGNALGAADAAAGQWAWIMAGSLRGQKTDGKTRLWVVSFATVQNDKYLEAIEYEIPFPGTSDGQKVQENIEKIEIWQKEGKGLGKKIGRSKVEGSALIAAIRPQVENEVSAQAGALISGGEDAWEQAAREYRPMMAAIAKSLSPGYTTAAVERRKQIANVKPNMGPNTKASKKSGRKKGGDK
ncbi:MAG: type I-E CRISPR-associated protein Cse1/CasA [Deltaproteobacteria bacterium]|nr:type I-E CRISPR-associated protein Cse1/CasA [Deltaproteobacteria bacterium]